MNLTKVMKTFQNILELCYRVILQKQDNLFPYANFVSQVPDSAIRECRNYTDLTGKEFMDPTTDKTTDVKAKQLPLKTKNICM